MEQTQLSGLFYIEDVVPQDLITTTLDLVNSKPWIIPDDKEAACRVYATTAHHHSWVDAELPEPLRRLIDIAEHHVCVLPNDIDQIRNIKYELCGVNKYKIGDGVHDHIDHTTCPIVPCFTLIGEYDVDFKIDGVIVYTLRPKPGSLYIMSGHSRYDCTHGVAVREHDIVDDAIVPRTQRISVVCCINNNN